jgi:hypothetical protein
MEEVEKISSSETLTARINKYYLNRLRQEASEKEITVNALVNQIVKHHIYWHSISPKAGFIPVRKEFIKRLFEKHTEEEVAEIGQAMGKHKTRDMLMLVGNNFNLIGTLEMIEVWIRASGYNYRRKIEGNKYACTIEHSMGQKWSIYLSEIFQGVFNEFNLKPSFQSTPDVLMFEIEFE